jgi:hypothetical protein
MEEMLAVENLDILYPARLPDGYEFTEFVVTDFGDFLEVWAGGSEPYISFIARIGMNVGIEHYDYEVNGIRYHVVELDENSHQAGWVCGADYYTIVVSDSATISEIIESLRRN